MWKLLRNYLRSLKKDLLQIFGLGILVIIMVTSFLSLNFANSYVRNQYLHDIAQNQLHQDMQITYPINNFAVPSKKFLSKTWLSNLDYQWLDDNDKIAINLSMFKNATFQIRSKINNPANHEYVYQFYFSQKSGDSSTTHLHVGDTLQQATAKSFVEFRLAVPTNFQLSDQQTRGDYLDQLAAAINPFVYDPNLSNQSSQNQDNQTNFFILGLDALKKYDSSIKNKYEWAKRNYSSDDIMKQYLLYRALIINMLYGEHQMFWNRSVLYRDLIMTGKTMAFQQTDPTDQINRPIMIDDGGISLKVKPLEDNDIIITPLFAQLNHLRVNQNYVFAGDNYRIRGIATSSLAASTGYYFDGVVDNKNQTVAFVNNSTFNRISNKTGVSSLDETFFCYHPEDSANLADNINNYWLYQYLHQRFLTGLQNGLYDFGENVTNLFNDGIDTIALLNPINNSTPSPGTRLFEWSSWLVITKVQSVFTTIASAFLILIFVITSVIIFIIIYKIIDRNKRLIGILKASGYDNLHLAVPLIFSIIVPMFLFSILGAVLSVFVSHFIIGSYSSLLILIYHGWSFNFLITILVTTLPLLGLTLISLIFVFYLLRIPALLLVNNQLRPKKNLHDNGFFSRFLTQAMIRKVSFRNKLVLITTVRGFTKNMFIIIISFFASTLLLFSFASSGLVNNMLGLQFAGINYNYSADYLSTKDINDNFLNSNNQLLYQTKTTAAIKSQPSLYIPLRQAFQNIISQLQPTSQIVDFRGGYLMGSELNEINQNVILPNLDLINQKIPGFKKFWNDNKYYIDYLTNQNGQNQTNLMITFGLTPFDKNKENPVIKMTSNSRATYNFSVNQLDNRFKYNNQTGKLEGPWEIFKSNSKTLYGVNQQSNQFLSPRLVNSNFLNFTNLTLDKMTQSSYWLDQNFISTSNAILKALDVSNPSTANVQVVPLVASTIGGYQDNNSNSSQIGRAINFQYHGFDGQTKYIIGVIYDNAKQLINSNVLLPQAWLRQSLFGSFPETIIKNYDNAKLSQLNSDEFKNYFTLLSTKNHYQLDITKLSNSNYLVEQGIKPAISNSLDINAVKTLLKTTQYTFQSLITIFSIFSVFLSFMIIIIISNINVRDNLGLISILRSLGFSNGEISYIFLIATIPMVIIFSLFAIYLAPVLVTIVGNGLASFTKQVFPIIFRWWYYAITLLIIILIYFVSYCITWKLNISNKQLLDLTK